MIPTMASMPVPRIVFDKLIEALAIVALGSSSHISVVYMEEACVVFVNNGLCSSREAPISENIDSAGTDDIEDADVSIGSIMD